MRLTWLLRFLNWLRLRRMLEIWILEPSRKPRTNKPTRSRRLTIFLTIQRFGSLIRLLRLLQFLRLSLKLGVLLPNILILLLEINQLTKKQVAIVLLTCILNLQFLILLLKNLVVIINLLCNLCHCFQVLGKLALTLLEIILVVFFLSCFLTQLFPNFIDLVIQMLENVNPLVLHLLPNELSRIANGLSNFFEVVRQFTNTITPELIIHQLSILFLNLSLLRNDFGLLTIMNVDPIQKQIVLVVDFVINHGQRMRRILLLLFL